MGKSMVLPSTPGGLVGSTGGKYLLAYLPTYYLSTYLTYKMVRFHLTNAAGMHQLLWLSTASQGKGAHRCHCRINPK